MLRSVRGWFRDENGWTLPEGRPAELVLLVVVLPIGYGYYAPRVTGAVTLSAHPVAALVGVCCGYYYAVYGRDRICSLGPGWLRWFASTFVLGSAGLSLLETVHLATPTLVAALTGGTAVAAVYLAWLCWPVSTGLTPPRRGVEPPPSLESGEASASR